MGLKITKNNNMLDNFIEQVNKQNIYCALYSYGHTIRAHVPIQIDL